MKTRISIVLIAIITLIGLGSLTLNSKQPVTVYSSGVSVINTNNLEEVIGLADYVFIGVVDSKRESFEKYVGMPLTSYDITVIENIKGKLKKNKSLDMIKDGGITEDGKYIVLNEDDFMPEEDLFYIFYAAAQNDGSLMITGQTLLENTSDKTELNSSPEYKEFRDAAKAEVKFERKRYKSKHDE